MSNSIELLLQNRDDFTESEKKIVDFILKEPNNIIKFPIGELARETKTSIATVTRFSQKLGYEGFAEFKFDLSRKMFSFEDQLHDSNALNYTTVIFDKYIEYIERFKQDFNQEELDFISKKIISSKRLKIFGLNRTGLSAQQLRMRLTKVGIDAEACTDMILMSSLSSVLTAEDTVIIFSTRALMHDRMIDELVSTNCTIILVTMNAKMKKKKRFDQILTIPSISQDSGSSFLDDQLLYYLFIELLIADLSFTLREK